MFAKIFNQIFASSIAENYQVRHIFMDLLVLADRDGVVDMTPQAIARTINVPLELLTSSLSTLSTPDPDSRSPDEDGRRIVLLDAHRDWGWRIVNFAAYHKMRNEDGRRDYQRDYQQKRRNDKKNNSLDVNTSSSSVNTSSSSSTPSTHIDIDIDTDTDVDTKEETSPPTAVKPSKKSTRENPWADAFKSAFDSMFPEKYAWQAGDFVHLAKWTKAYPDVSIERFIEVAEGCWSRGQYLPKNSLTIRGLCAGWAPLAASISGAVKPKVPKALPGPLRSIYGDDVVGGVA